MNAELITQVSRQTLDGTMSFPEAVANLISAGVEYYQVDYVALSKKFYSADGEVVTTPIDYENLPSVAADFAVDELRADIRDSQEKNQPYREFTTRAMKAGVQGYFAFLRGKRVTYLGRQGDQHIEWFPQ